MFNADGDRGEETFVVVGTGKLSFIVGCLRVWRGCGKGRIGEETIGVEEVFARSRVIVRVKARVEGAAGQSHVG